MLLKQKTNEVDKHSKEKSLEVMFEAQSREVSQMTLVLFLISSFRSLGELEDVCVFTGFRGSFGKETAQLLRSHSTPRP